MRTMASLVAVGLFMLGGTVSASASESLKAIVESYVTIQEQLAADKIDGVKAPARAIAAQAAAMGQKGVPIAMAATRLESASDVKAVREAFGALSDAVIKVGSAEGWKDVEGVRLAFCPMVDRSWLQKHDKIKNPYYGSSMLTCGEFKPLK